ncbi:MAG: SDR family NAD(P)-dependent oxidoreductase [Pseudomonadota bacterium]
MPATPTPRTPSFRLDGRRALVTGAGRGIGRGAAIALAEAGAAVTLVSRSANELAEVAAEIEALGATAEAVVLDVTDLRAVADALRSRPAFDVLVNNAGGNRPASFLDVREEEFDVVFELNVKAAFFVAQAVARRMVEQGVRGSIIMVSSQLGHVGAPSRSVYCASKHAVEGLTKAMTLDLAPHGIRVNTLCPTFVETPMTAAMLADPAFRAGVEANIPLGRVARVEDLMGAIRFLACDASALMSGTSIVVDGGWTAR